VNNRSFYVNRVGGTHGYSIFGHRLKQALLEKGHKWNNLLPDVSFVFVTGFFRPFTTNILRLDGLYFDSENTIGDSDRLNRPIFKACKKADAIIFQSEFDRLLFHNRAGTTQKAHKVVCNGVPAQFSPRGDRVDYGFKKTLICCAQWRSHKRLDCIIRGFLEYGEPGVGLVIIGEGTNGSRQHPSIRYVGGLLPDELPKHLRGGNAFVHLSWLDHCPNTVVEAVACGLPVLCSHNGGTKEIVRSNGIVIQCEEDYAFTDVALYEPPRCDKRIVAEGMRKILDWDKPVEADYLNIGHTADEYMLFYENVKG